MKAYKYPILITLLLFLVSCQKDLDLIETQSNQPVAVVEKTYYDLDFYAMARRGSTWKGNRMIREEKK